MAEKLPEMGRKGNNCFECFVRGKTGDRKQTFFGSAQLLSASTTEILGFG